jgi:hypothetical protein
VALSGLEDAQLELLLEAEAAMADDFVQLKRLEQQVAIAEARTLVPATELAELPYELDLLKVR